MINKTTSNYKNYDNINLINKKSPPSTVNSNLSVISLTTAQNSNSKTSQKFTWQTSGNNTQIINQTANSTATTNSNNPIIRHQMVNKNVVANFNRTVQSDPVQYLVKKSPNPTIVILTKPATSTSASSSNSVANPANSNNSTITAITNNDLLNQNKIHQLQNFNQNTLQNKTFNLTDTSNTINSNIFLPQLPLSDSNSNIIYSTANSTNYTNKTMKTNTVSTNINSPNIIHQQIQYTLTNTANNNINSINVNSLLKPLQPITLIPVNNLNKDKNIVYKLNNIISNNNLTVDNNKMQSFISTPHVLESNAIISNNSMEINDSDIEISTATIEIDSTEVEIEPSQIEIQETSIENVDKYSEKCSEKLIPLLESIPSENNSITNNDLPLINRKNIKRSVITRLDVNNSNKSSDVTRCICEMDHDDGFMICCDKCLVWQHIACMLVNRKKIPEKFFCEKCLPRTVNISKAKSIQKKYIKKLKKILLKNEQQSASTSALASSMSYIENKTDTESSDLDESECEENSLSLDGFIKIEGSELDGQKQKSSENANLNLDTISEVQENKDMNSSNSANDKENENKIVKAINNNQNVLLNELNVENKIQLKNDINNNKKRNRTKTIREELANNKSKNQGECSLTLKLDNEIDKKANNDEIKSEIKQQNNNNDLFHKVENKNDNENFVKDNYKKFKQNQYSDEFLKLFVNKIKLSKPIDLILNDLTKNTIDSLCNSSFQKKNNKTELMKLEKKISSNTLAQSNVAGIDLRIKDTFFQIKAKQSIKSDQIIGEYFGKIMLEEESRSNSNPFMLFYDIHLENLQSASNNSSTSSSFISSSSNNTIKSDKSFKASICIDSSTIGNNSRYIRKSCAPNSKIMHLIDNNGEIHFFITSTANILKGDEITLPFDYNKNEINKENCNCFICLCETKNCYIKSQQNHVSNGQIKVCILNKISDSDSKKMSSVKRKSENSAEINVTNIKEHIEDKNKSDSNLFKNEVITNKEFSKKENNESKINPSSIKKQNDVNEKKNTELNKKQTANIETNKCLSREDRKLMSYVRVIEKLEKQGIRKKELKQQKIDAAINIPQLKTVLDDNSEKPIENKKDIIKNSKKSILNVKNQHEQTDHEIVSIIGNGLIQTSKKDEIQIDFNSKMLNSNSTAILKSENISNNSYSACELNANLKTKSPDFSFVNLSIKPRDTLALLQRNITSPSLLSSENNNSFEKNISITVNTEYPIKQSVPPLNNDDGSSISPNINQHVFNPKKYWLKCSSVSSDTTDQCQSSPNLNSQPLKKRRHMFQDCESSKNSLSEIEKNDLEETEKKTLENLNLAKSNLEKNIENSNNCYFQMDVPDCYVQPPISMTIPMYLNPELNLPFYNSYFSSQHNNLVNNSTQDGLIQNDQSFLLSSSPSINQLYYTGCSNSVVLCDNVNDLNQINITANAEAAAALEAQKRKKVNFRKN